MPKDLTSNIPDFKVSINKAKQLVTKSSESIAADEMISYEIVYEPDVKDAHGEWMSADTIRAGRDNFELNRLAGNVKENLFHISPTDDFTIEKTWIQEELDVIVEGTEQKISAGSWVAKVKYNNNDLWNLKKSGIVGGLSIQCSGYISETGEITGLNFDPEDIED